METLKLGLVPSPELPTVLTGKIVDDLPDLLVDQVDEQTSWKPEIVIDPLIGSDEYMNELMDKVIDLKNKNNWDYMICLTDLPHFSDKHIIMAEINHDDNVALISIPAFRSFPLTQRIKQSICQVIKDMYPEKAKESSIKAGGMTRTEYSKQRKANQGDPF